MTNEIKQREMTLDEALKLLRGGADGIAEWNRCRDEDEEVPSLKGADLRGADLSGANLSGAKGLPATPVVPRLHRDVAAIVGPKGEHLDMGVWHSSCGTAHCRAGAAIVAAGPEGEQLEGQYGSSVAGALIYQASVGYVPNFFATDEVALADIRARAEES